MQKNTLIRIIVILVFAVIVGTPLFYFRWGVYPYTLAKQLFFQSGVEIIFFLWLALAIADKKYRPKRTPLMLALGGFLSVLTAAAVFGVDPLRSFWSTYERTIGVVAFYHFAALALVLSSLAKEIPWKKLFYASLATAFLIDIIAWIQLYVPNFLLEENPGSRPGATFGNPTFLSEYLLFNVFIALYLSFDQWKRPAVGYNERQAVTSPRATPFVLIFLIASLIFNVAAIFHAQTRGDILGLGLGLIVLMFFFAVRPPAFGPASTRVFGEAGEARPARRPQLRFRFLSLRRFYALFLLIILLAGSAFWFTKNNDFWSRFPGLSRFREISFSSLDTAFGPRLIALRASWKGFLEKPFLGWGPENFNIVFNKHYDPRALEANYGETRFDKPHNLAIEYLVTGGVTLAAAFLALLAAFLYEASRLKDKLWAAVIVAGVASYVVSELFVFDTVGPLLMFYLLLGFVDGKYRGEKTEESGKKKEEREISYTSHLRSLPPSSFLLPLLALVLMYFINILTLQASYYQYLAFTDIIGGRRAAGFDNFRKAISTWSPYKWNFERDYAAETAQIYFYNPGYVSADDVMGGVRAMENARDAHPLDAYNHYALIDIYNQVSALDPQKFTALAEKEAEIALRLSPDRQEIYFSLAKTKNIEGDNPAALVILKKALDLNPNVPEAHFYYGLLLFATNDSTAGYREIKQAVDMGRKWKTFYEPRTVAGYFGDAGHLDEAIDLYKTALQMEPMDVETEIKLGMAYFLKDDLDNARKYLGAAAKKFDFKKSERYPEFKPILDRLGIQ